MTALADHPPLASTVGRASGDSGYASAPAPSQATADTAGLLIGIIDSLEALDAIGPDWNALFADSGRPPQVFQTHAFAVLFARTFGLDHSAETDDACPCRLAIVTVRRRGRLVMIWPLVSGRRFGMNYLNWLGEPITQYGDVLAAGDDNPATLLEMAYEHIKANLAPDILRLRRVRSDATIAPFLDTLGIPATELVEAPCVTLAAGGSPFEARQSGKAKKNRRRLMRRLEERGQVAFREVAPGADAASAIAAAMADKREWLLRRGLVSPALGEPHVDQFFVAAFADTARATGCALFELSLDAKPVAVAIGFRCKQRLMLHFITYAADVEKQGVGVLNLEAILRLAETEGLEAVDMLPPQADYKLAWSDTAMVAGDRVWGTSQRGRLWAAAVERVAVPALKVGIGKLPLGARKKLAALSLRGVSSTHSH